MKKALSISSIIVLVAIMLAVLVGCNNATPQGQLKNPLGDHKCETFVYDALNTYDQTTGTYVVKLQAFDSGATVSDFGDSELKDVPKGILVTGELTIGTDRSLTGCYFRLVSSSTSYMKPTASYTVHYQNGAETFRLQATYSSKYFEYTRTILGNAEKAERGKLKISGSVYDNNEFHQLLRTVSTYSSGLTLAYEMPLVTEKEALVADITAVSSTATTKVSTPYTLSLLDSTGAPRFEDGLVDCYQLTITRSTKVIGASQKLYYAVKNIGVHPDYSDTRAFKNILLKIEEPFKVGDQATVKRVVDGKEVEEGIMMVYTLRSATM